MATLMATPCKFRRAGAASRAYLEHPPAHRRVAHGRRDDELFQKDGIRDRRFALFDLRQAVLSILRVPLLEAAAQARNLDACGDLGDLLLGGGPELGPRLKRRASLTWQKAESPLPENALKTVGRP